MTGRAARARYTSVKAADQRPGRSAGKPPASPARPASRQRARERIAAERAARRRTEARRRLLLPIGVVTAVVAIVVSLAVVKLTSSPARLVATESPAPAAVARSITTVPDAMLAQVNSGQVATSLQTVTASGPPLAIGGKPAIVFVSEESCPFCAAERWPLAVALSHFGTWSQLGITRSAATDIYPGTATLSFRTAQYHSAELTLRTTELTDNAYRPLQAPTSLDRQLIGTYDVPPFVNSADQSGSVPFLDIGNQYILAEIAAQLRNPSSPVAQAIDGSAKVIIAAINQVLHEQTARG
jgi:hypothetical protein